MEFVVCRTEFIVCRGRPWADRPYRKRSCLRTTAPFSCNISYADHAIAMVDEIEKGHHINQRISVVGA